MASAAPPDRIEVDGEGGRRNQRWQGDTPRGDRLQRETHTQPSGRARKRPAARLVIEIGIGVVPFDTMRADMRHAADRFPDHAAVDELAGYVARMR